MNCLVIHRRSYCSRALLSVWATRSNLRNPMLSSPTATTGTASRANDSDQCGASGQTDRAMWSRRSNLRGFFADFGKHEQGATPAGERLPLARRDERTDRDLPQSPRPVHRRGVPERGHSDQATRARRACVRDDPLRLHHSHYWGRCFRSASSADCGVVQDTY